MKVYIAKRVFDHEGFDIVGVFSTKEAAGDCCMEDITSLYGKFADNHEVEEHELQHGPI